MDGKRRLSEQTEEPGSLHGESKEDGLLNSLTQTIRGLEAVRRSRRRGDGAAGGRRCTAGEEGAAAAAAAAAAEEEEENECKRKALRVLRELRATHSNRAAAWRGALREWAGILASPHGGADQRHASTTVSDHMECKIAPCPDFFSHIFRSVMEDMENIKDKLSAAVTKLDAEILQSSAEENLSVATAPEDSSEPETSEQAEDLNSHDPQEPASGQRQEMEKDEAEAGQAREASAEKCIILEKTGKDEQEETNRWITVGLPAQVEDSCRDVADACFIRAPAGAAGVLRCEVADTLSCLMVTGSEELVSRVIRVTVREGADVRFPVTVAVPFCARYRGNYRTVAVKVVDGERRASYITPVTTEGAYGGQRGSFAEVRVYSLGLFAAVSCLKRESYTVPTRGLSHKFSADPRICLSYPPGSFAAPVMAQSVVQPVDAVLLAAVKSRSDAYQWVASTSPMLHLIHPTSQPLRRPLTIGLPCPPNADRKRDTRGPGERSEGRHSQPANAPSVWDHSSSRRTRLLSPSAPPSSTRTSTELLTILGSRDKQWSVLEKVNARNQQSGLVAFELAESFDSLLVLRHLAPVQHSHLAALVEELEECVRRHTVTIVLQRRQDEPHTALVAVLPSRDLSWELSKLQAQGYGGLLETSSEISMSEGDQLLLRLSGNITAKGTQSDQHGVLHERITFHIQRRNGLLVHLTEVDPFGNHSSPHYKGTATFYRFTRGQVEWRGDRPAPVDPKLLGDPVCKMSLTLPKKKRTIKRPIMTRVKLCEEAESLSDSLLLWLSGELSQEDIASLVLSLRLRRSTTQLVKLRAGDNLSAQAFHLLAMWRRELPAAQHQPKASQLANCLAKSGRPDLAGELLLRQAAATRQGMSH